MEIDFLFKGLAIGFSIAAPVGPISLLCLRRSLAHGRAAGLASGMGAATADGIYGAIAAFGLVVYWTAWTWVFFGDTCFPSEALAEFDGTRWMLMVLVTVTPIAAVALALGL